MSESICEYHPSAGRDEAFVARKMTHKPLMACLRIFRRMDSPPECLIARSNLKACPNGPIEFLVELAMSNIFTRACDVLGRENLLPELCISGWLQHP
jgi:hypothetical protein